MKHTVIAGESGRWMFQLEGSDKVWELPLLGSLPVKKSRDIARIAEGTEVEQLDAMVELFDGLCPGLTDVISASQMTEVITEWCAASGVTVGESQTSSN